VLGSEIGSPECGSQFPRTLLIRRYPVKIENYFRVRGLNEAAFAAAASRGKAFSILSRLT
jgi:hypothetical protein